MDSEWFVHTIYAWMLSFADNEEAREQIDKSLLEAPTESLNTKRERARKFKELMSRG